MDFSDLDGCSAVKELIKRHHFQIRNVVEDKEKCIVDFKHPKIVVMKPVSYFLSSVVYKKDGSFLNATIRNKVDDVKELYLDYCCENGEQVCRPHVHMGEKILSVEVKFRENPLGKFDRILEEMS